jgi:hypothetical protein
MPASIIERLGAAVATRPLVEMRVIQAAATTRKDLRKSLQNGELGVTPILVRITFALHPQNDYGEGWTSIG